MRKPLTMTVPQARKILKRHGWLLDRWELKDRAVPNRWGHKRERVYHLLQPAGPQKATVTTDQLKGMALDLKAGEVRG